MGIAVLLACTAFALLAHFIIFRGLLSAPDLAPAIQAFIRRALWPTRIALVLLTILLVLQISGLPDELAALIHHVAALIFIGSVAWLVIALLYAMDYMIAGRYRFDIPDNPSVRRLRTRLDVLRRFGIAIVLVISASAMLMTFPAVQALGASLLASAGLVGIIAGIAAQKTIGNLIAGLLIAATQPIRLDDVVVIDGEWGWVEEIGMTHVFVRIWDLRRLVIPLSYILEHPVQNWTRHCSNVLGTVVIYSDYTVPVDALRQALGRILEQTALWDRQVWNLQVTDTTPSGLELRALMSASTGPIAWDLRCHVREKLVEFLREQYPDSLPMTRVIVADTPAADEVRQKSAA